MKVIKTYENWLTKKGQKKDKYDKYLYDNGFGDRYYICSDCGTFRLTPISSGGFSPPTWKCDDCGEINFSPKSMEPEAYRKDLERRRMNKESEKFNL